MTGPIPDPATGLLDTSDEVHGQLNALAVYLKEHRVAFTLQYVPEQGYWFGLLVIYEESCSIVHIGRFPTEVIYRLLKEVT